MCGILMRTLFDLAKLFVGSQGALGFITDITFDLVKPYPACRMLVMFLRAEHFSQLSDIVDKVLKH